MNTERANSGTLRIHSVSRGQVKLAYRCMDVGQSTVEDNATDSETGRTELHRLGLDMKSRTSGKQDCSNQTAGRPQQTETEKPSGSEKPQSEPAVFSTDIDARDKRKKRHQINRACPGCRAAKAACQDTRPCARCVSRPIDDSDPSADACWVTRLDCALKWHQAHS